jgi:hypothetical protein
VSLVCSRRCRMQVELPLLRMGVRWMWRWCTIARDGESAAAGKEEGGRAQRSRAGRAEALTSTFEINSRRTIKFKPPTMSHNASERKLHHAINVKLTLVPVSR